jgi:tetratricopeptide (TPR) repeat protein
MAESLSDAGLRLRALNSLALNYGMMGELRKAIEIQRNHTEGPGAELAKGIPSPFSAVLYLNALSWRSTWHTQLGEFGDAVKYGDLAVQFADDIAVPRAKAFAFLYRGHVSRIRGEFEAALPFYLRALEISEAEGMRFWVSNAAIFLGRTLAELGRSHEGIQQSLRGITLQVEMGTRVNLANLRASHAITLLLAGRNAEAREEADLVLRLARESVSRGQEAVALMTLGRVLLAPGLDDAKAAAAAFAQGQSISQGLGMRPFAGHCHFGLGQAFARSDERGKAREQLSAAAALFRGMGMAYYLERAEVQLAGL